MRSRTPLLAAVTALAALVAVAGCTHATPLTNALSGSSVSSSNVATAPSSGQTSTTGVLTAPSTIASKPTKRSSSASKGTVSKGSTTKKGERVAAPIGGSLSGVICSYVSRSDVTPVLAGVGGGFEDDLAPVAVSYCEFNANPYGTVNVGVKNMGDAATATGQVHSRYSVMSNESDQSSATFTAAGQFAFQIGSTTPLKNGVNLYAVNAEGSRGSWYVQIQLYSHSPCSQSAMRHLLETVLSNVP